MATVGVKLLKQTDLINCS